MRALIPVVLWVGLTAVVLGAGYFMLHPAFH
jgi:hypothetical protein